MKNKNYLLLIIVSIFLALTLFFVNLSNTNLKNLSADSGFDSDWGGSDWGSSDWGSSDWGSSDWGGSDWGSSDWGGSSSSYDSYSSEVNAWVHELMIILLITVIIVSIINSNKNRNAIKDRSIYENEEALKKILAEIPDFNKQDFYNAVYENFVSVQNAWTEFDYDTLRTLLTDELFNTYKTELKTLETKKQKNIMSDFRKDCVAINGFSKSAKTYTFEVLLKARFYDYLATIKGNVLKGSDKRRIIITYKLTYVKSINNKPNKCPNCNANLKTIASNVCPYCKSTIVSDTHDLILAKKEAINQVME